MLTAPRDHAKIIADVRDMRERIAAEKGTSDIWDLKQVRGGLVDLEFIAQHLQLFSAAQHPGVLDQNTHAALAKLNGAGVLDQQSSAQLDRASLLINDLTQVLRLSLDTRFDPHAAPGGLKALLVKASGAASFEDLEARLKREQAAVYAAFETVIR